MLLKVKATIKGEEINIKDFAIEKAKKILSFSYL